MKPWVRYAIAFVIAGHGLVYFNAARGVLPVFDGWRERSWLLGGAVTGLALRRLAVVLWTGSGLGLMGTAAVLAFAPEAEEAWRPLAAASSAVAVLGFFVFWDGRPALLVAQGAIGMVLSLAILLAALVYPQALGAAGR